MWRGPAADLPASCEPPPDANQEKAAEDDDRADTAPGSINELWFDGSPGKPGCISFAVQVFPETESVLVYVSRDNPGPIRCEGPLAYFTIMTDTGRIFVERLPAVSSVEITIVAATASA
jgi:hypothetical protein